MPDSILFKGTQVLFRAGQIVFGDCVCCPGSCWYRWSQSYDCDSETWGAVTEDDSQEGIGIGGTDNPFDTTPDTWVKVFDDGSGCIYYYVTQGDPGDDGACDNWPSAPAGQSGTPGDCGCTTTVSCSDLPIGNGGQDVSTTGHGYSLSGCGGTAVSTYDTISVTYSFNGVGGTVEARASSGAANPLVCRFPLSCDESNNLVIGSNVGSCAYSILGGTDHGAGSGGSCTIAVTSPTTVRVTISGVSGCGCLGTGGPPADSYTVDASPVNDSFDLTIS